MNLAVKGEQERGDVKGMWLGKSNVGKLCFFGCLSESSLNKLAFLNFVLVLFYCNFGSGRYKSCLNSD